MRPLLHFICRGLLDVKCPKEVGTNKPLKPKGLVSLEPNYSKRPYEQPFRNKGLVSPEPNYSKRPNKQPFRNKGLVNLETN